MAEVTTISKEQHLQLVGLQALAEQHTKALEDIQASILAIVGGDDENGDVSDVLYADRSIKWLLERRKISVVSEKKRARRSGS